MVIVDVVDKNGSTDKNRPNSGFTYLPSLFTPDPVTEICNDKNSINVETGNAAVS